LVWIGLAIVGVPYALVLGLSTGILNVVPYLGPFVGALIAGIVGLFVSPMTGLLAVVVIIAAQQLTDVFVTPRVMSSQVDLHPLLVIFSLLVGGTLFGFWGLILAIPVAAIGKGLFVYYYERSTNRVISTEDGVLFKSKCAEATPECSDTDAIDEETQA
ncbi:MAG: AI-2E family transporter, partial [Actinomycetota bacterium]|nr:AI-2E family transporter [Actinomycetota bacterium]